MKKCKNSFHWFYGHVLLSKMYIGAIDKKATAKLQKKEMRAVKRLKFECKNGCENMKSDKK